jgi:3-oxoacyl-[acyl-carrier-protein] synthase-3
MPRSYIVGTGYCLPERVITNAELLARVETTEDWILSHTGIVERRAAAAEVNTSDLGAAATRDALERTGWRPADLDLLVCATSTPDALIPATASYIGQKLRIDPVAFDVNAACSGFVYGLSVVDALVRTEGYRRAALCTAEKYTRVTDYDDRATCIFFGDSAATVLLQPERPRRGFEIVDLALFNTNEGADYVKTPVGGYFRQDGRLVKEYALRCFERSAKELLGRNGVAVSDLRAFAAHQANLRVLETVAKAVGLRPEQHWHNVASCGNQGAAGVITTFCSRVAAEAQRFRSGDLFLMTVFGSGFTTGSVLLRWIDDQA